MSSGGVVWPPPKDNTTPPLFLPSRIFFSQPLLGSFPHEPFSLLSDVRFIYELNCLTNTLSRGLVLTHSLPLFTANLSCLYPDPAR